MKTINVSVPGKIFFLGEHSVVYGKPALLSTINRYCTVQIIPSSKQEIVITSKQLSRTITLSPATINKKTHEAQKQWQQYVDTNDVSFLQTITKDPMQYPLIAIGETLQYYKAKMPAGCTMLIDSDIPMGAGLGSSASCAVGIATAITAFLKKELKKEIISEIALLIEQKRHGFPSGADTAAVCFGGFIWYRKETADLKIIQSIPFMISPILLKRFVLIDTGAPVESTGDMVASVKQLLLKSPKRIERVLYDQETITRNFLTALKQENEKNIIDSIKQGEKNLEKIEVVSPSAKKLIRAIEKFGGAAKICGAGGRKNGSGIVLAYHSHPEKLLSLATKQSLTAFAVTLGKEGMHYEQN